MHNTANPPITNSQKVINPAREKARTQDTPTIKRRTIANVSAGKGLAYEWFLGLPVPVVLLMMWVVGAPLLGAWALLAYAGISALVGMVEGAF